MEHLLAVDLGLRTGLALLASDGRLCWYRSHNLGSITRLRRAVNAIVAEPVQLAWLFGEGDRHLFQVWEKAAQRRGAQCRLVSAETWRPTFLYERERRGGPAAKSNAIEVARRIIQWSGLPATKGLRHDTAEAILIGLYGVLSVGWLDRGALREAGIV